MCYLMGIVRCGYNKKKKISEKFAMNDINNFNFLNCFHFLLFFLHRLCDWG